MPDIDWDAPVTFTLRYGDAAAVVQTLGGANNRPAESERARKSMRDQLEPVPDSHRVEEAGGGSSAEPESRKTEGPAGFPGDEARDKGAARSPATGAASTFDMTREQVADFLRRDESAERVARTIHYHQAQGWEDWADFGGERRAYAIEHAQRALNALADHLLEQGGDGG